MTSISLRNCHDSKDLTKKSQNGIKQQNITTFGVKVVWVPI